VTLEGNIAGYTTGRVSVGDFTIVRTKEDILPLHMGRVQSILTCGVEGTDRNLFLGTEEAEGRNGSPVETKRN